MTPLPLGDMPAAVTGRDWRWLANVADDVALLMKGAECRLLALPRAARRLHQVRLSEQWGQGLTSQPLLMPLTLTLPADLRALLSQETEWVSKLGIEWRAVNAERIVVSRVPAALRQTDVNQTLPALLQKLSFSGQTDDFAEDICAWLARQSAGPALRSANDISQLLADLSREFPAWEQMPDLSRAVPLASMIEDLLRDH